jgi:hypothetical protein
VTGAGQKALQQSTPNWRGTALQYPHNAKKNESSKKDTQTQRKQTSGFERGWCGKFEKKNNEHITGCGIFANRVPRFPLFPPSTLPLDNNNLFILRVANYKTAANASLTKTNRWMLPLTGDLARVNLRGKGITMCGVKEADPRLPSQFLTGKTMNQSRNLYTPAVAGTLMKRR